MLCVGRKFPQINNLNEPQNLIDRNHEFCMVLPKINYKFDSNELRLRCLLNQLKVL